LTISAELVRLMGGAMSVESVVGAGSTFAFSACFGAGERATTQGPSAAAADLNGLRVLVVDDSETNRTMVTTVLRSWGLHPTTADGGRAALEALSTTSADQGSFRVVLVDAGMPGVDGFDVAEAIQLSSDPATATIVMLTADRQTADLERCRALGVSAYLIKPVLEADLHQAILTALGASDQRSTARRAVEPRRGEELLRPLCILVADDNAVNLKVICRLLEKHGHEVICASTGRQVLEQLGHGSVDAVLMDIEMPDIDGLEVTAEIRRLESTRPVGSAVAASLPIIALTAHAIKGDRERFLAAGMDGYVTKPINTKELFRTIASVVERRDREGGGSTRAAKRSRTYPTDDEGRELR
jgi:CheY-like chemotaxis protein